MGRYRNQYKPTEDDWNEVGRKRKPGSNRGFILCSTYASGSCKGWKYLSQMAREEVTCKLCSALYPREHLSATQQEE